MTRIFYYSGRGNSLWVARTLAARLPEARLTRITRKLADRGEDLAAEEVLGFVLPTIDFGLPISVRRFLRALRLESSSPYVFAALTTGGMPAGTLGQMEGLLARRGIKLSAATILPFSLSPGDEERRERGLASLCAAVASRENLAYDVGGLKERLIFSGLINSAARLMIPREDAKFSVSEACNSCGLCARLCPAANIELRDGLPNWKHRCEQCGSCFAWCPQEAITGSCLAAKTRYRNPHIEMAELLGGSDELDRATPPRRFPEAEGEAIA